MVMDSFGMYNGHCDITDESIIYKCDEIVEFREKGVKLDYGKYYGPKGQVYVSSNSVEVKGILEVEVDTVFHDSKNQESTIPVSHFINALLANRVLVVKFEELETKGESSKIFIGAIIGMNIDLGKHKRILEIEITKVIDKKHSDSLP